MFSPGSRLCRRLAHSKLRRSPIIHRRKQDALVSDYAKSHFVANFETAKAICEKHRKQIDVLNKLLLVQSDKLLEERADVEEKMLPVLSSFRSALENKNRRLIPIGSSVNGLAKKSSDLDLVLMPYTDVQQCATFRKKFEYSESFRRTFMKAVASLIKSTKVVDPQTIFMLHSAKVPIIKMCTKSGLDVDIQFGNSETILSSLFVRSCIESNPAVYSLINCLNSNFTMTGIKNPGSNLFSSYHVNMLVLHFMSVISAIPDLINGCPQLSPDCDWNGPANLLLTRSPILLPSNSNACSLTAGQLLVHLIDYYSQIDLHRFSIATTGKVSPRVVDKNNSNPDMSFVSLLDPYFNDGKLTNCRVMNGCSMIHEHFSAMLNQLKTGTIPRSLENALS